MINARDSVTESSVTRFKHLLATHVELANRVDDLEQRSTDQEGPLSLLFDVVHRLMMLSDASDTKEEQPSREIGFHVR
jgi:hypothetical protein